MEQPLRDCPECGAPVHSGPCYSGPSRCKHCGSAAHSGPCSVVTIPAGTLQAGQRYRLSGDGVSDVADPVADLQTVFERLEQQASEPLEPREHSEGLRQLAEAFAARHGYTPPPGAAPPELDPSLRFAIDSGMMSEGQARDLDAFADGLVARVRAGELTEEQGDALCIETAIRDAQAVKRARNRAARRAEASKRRRRK